jgi:UDP-glucose 4-epimerase
VALILVTGARGAIGRRVVALAKARGDHVVGVGHGSWTFDAELPDIDLWINGEIDIDNLFALAREVGPPDVVIHLAGGSLVASSISHPGEDFRRTVESSQRLLEWMRTSAASARLVVASSAAVYGGGHHCPIVESTEPNPASPYGTHKAVMEMLCRSYTRDFGMRIAILRLFSVYGPGLRKQLIWDLSGRLHRGETCLVLGGTGEETRDFLHIDDAAAMLLDAAPLADAPAPLFNACSGRAVGVAEVAGLVTQFFAGASPTFSGRSRAGDPLHLVGDPGRAQAAGLKVAIGLEEGVAQTLSWIRGALTAARS